MTRVGKNSGFSLIEVMVSVVLLTTSLLGVAALQSASTKYDNQAYFRSQSVIQVGEMIDRLRANPAGVSDGYYDVSPIPESYPADENCGLSTVTCTAEELAVYDLVNWNSMNAQVLPGGVGSITQSVGNRIIRVSWIEQQDKSSVSDGYVNPCDGGSNQALHCFTLVIRI